MENRVAIDFKGKETLRKNLLRLAKQYPQAARREIYIEFETIMTNSKENYVPVDDGQLKSSGHVVMDDDPKKIKVGAGFGGQAGIGNQGPANDEDVGYAVIQHEDENLNHPGVGESKYLEKPLLSAAGTMLQRIGDGIREDVGA
jgi:hypothetical protein